MNFREYHAMCGSSMARNCHDEWMACGEKAYAATWLKDIENPEAAADTYEMFMFGAESQTEGFGSWSFDFRDPAWTWILKESPYKPVTAEECLRDHPRYQLDYLGAGQIPGLDGGVWLCRIWDKKRNKQVADSWYCGPVLDWVVTVCWRLEVDKVDKEAE